jgi:hypothetical protein
VSRLENNAIWQLKSPNCQYLYLCQLSLFQAFDENENVVKVTFSSNLPFGTIISRALQAADYENIGRLKVGRPLSSYGGSTFSRTFYYNDGLYVEPGFPARTFSPSLICIETSFPAGTFSPSLICVETSFPAGTFNSPMLVTAPICTPGTRGKLYLNVT